MDDNIIYRFFICLISYNTAARYRARAWFYYESFVFGSLIIIIIYNIWFNIDFVSYAGDFIYLALFSVHMHVRLYIYTLIDYTLSIVGKSVSDIFYTDALDGRYWRNGSLPLYYYFYYNIITSSVTWTVSNDRR
jgi:hypothetical protein